MQPPIGAPGALSPSTTYTQKSRAQSAGRHGAAVHYVYVTNDGSANVSAFAINASTGALTQVPGSPFSAGPEPWGIAVDPTGKFAYVTNVTDGGTSGASGSVSAYAINASNGALTQVKGSPFSSGGIEPWEMAIGPAGNFAYVTNFYSDNVSAYAIDAKSGALTQVQGSPFGTGASAAGVAIDPAAKFAYVANDGGVSAYAKRSGALMQVQGSPFAAGSYPWGVTVDPRGKFAYVTNYDSGSVSAYAIDAQSGALTQVQGSPFAAGKDPYGVVIDPSGKFAYVANAYWGSSLGNISAYAIQRSGALIQVKGSPFAAGGGPVQLAIR